MRIDAHPEFDLVAQGVDEQIAVLVEITAPRLDPPDEGTRPRHTLQIVLDRSGSMAGDRLGAAKTALLDVLDRLSPDDNFGLVAFDHQTQVVVPAGPLRDRSAARSAIAALAPGGSTDLSGGYLRGLQEAERVAGPAGATVLLISDGHANRGVTDPERLGAIAEEAFGRGVTTSALGIGLGYDERLLAALARAGRGNDGFAEHADAAVPFIAGQAEGLLAQAAQAVSVLVRMEPSVRGVQLLNELPLSVLPNGTLIELGSLSSEETRTLTLVLDVPGGAPLGPLRLADLELSYARLPDLAPGTASVPLDVTVVTAAQAADRPSSPRVRTERVYQHAQQAKQRAAGALNRNDGRTALDELARARAAVQAAAATAPAEMADDLAEEIAVLTALTREAEAGRYARAAKGSMKDYADKNRNRGRQQSAGTQLDYQSWSATPEPGPPNPPPVPPPSAVPPTTPPRPVNHPRGRGSARPVPAEPRKDPRRAWIDLSEAVRTLPLDPADRERIARALVEVLNGRPDFDAARFHAHAVSRTSHP